MAVKLHLHDEAYQPEPTTNDEQNTQEAQKNRIYVSDTYFECLHNFFLTAGLLSNTK